MGERWPPSSRTPSRSVAVLLPLRSNNRQYVLSQLYFEQTRFLSSGTGSRHQHFMNAGKRISLNDMIRNQRGHTFIVRPKT